jgi:sugar lactone lactonase YvrE
MCQPFQLASVWDGAWGLAVGNAAVCVAIQLNNVMTCLDKTTGAKWWEADNVAVAQPSWVAMDETTLFWSNRVSTTGSIAHCAITGCVTPTKLIDPANRPNGVAVTGTHVYWAETNGKTVKRALKDGTGIETIVPSSLGWSPFLVTLHGGFVYFSERSAGRVARVPVAGGEVQVLGTSTQPSKVAVTEDWVFWTDSSALGSVYRVPNADPPDGGNAPQTFANAQASPFGIVADEQHVYWIVSANSAVAEGALRACPTTGCQGLPIELDKAIPYPTDVAMDDEALYYSVFGIDSAIDGAVRKVAKL